MEVRLSRSAMRYLRASRAKGRVRVGVSGWQCRESQSAFYPKKIASKLKLAYYARQTPPFLNKDLKQFEKFTALLPGDRRFVFEFRHSSWFSEDVYELLGRKGVCTSLSNSRIEVFILPST